MRQRGRCSNPIYYGGVSLIFAGVLYEGKHEPIITKDPFDQVQKAIAVRVPTPSVPLPTSPFA